MDKTGNAYRWYEKTVPAFLLVWMASMTMDHLSYQAFYLFPPTIQSGIILPVIGIVMPFLMFVVLKKPLGIEFTAAYRLKNSGQAFREMTPIWIFAVCFIPVALSSGYPVYREWELMNAIGCYAIAPALIEEASYRVFALFLLRKLMKRRENREQICLLLSAVVFSLAHAPNFIQGQDLTYTILQMAVSFGAGLIFGGIFMRYGTVLPCILGHLMINFTAGIFQCVEITIQDWFFTVVEAVIFVGTGIYQLKYKLSAETTR